PLVDQGNAISQHAALDGERLREMEIGANLAVRNDFQHDRACPSIRLADGLESDRADRHMREPVMTRPRLANTRDLAVRLAQVNGDRCARLDAGDLAVNRTEERRLRSDRDVVDPLDVDVSQFS